MNNCPVKYCSNKAFNNVLIKNVLKEIHMCIDKTKKIDRKTWTYNVAIQRKNATVHTWDDKSINDNWPRIKLFDVFDKNGVEQTEIMMDGTDFNLDEYIYKPKPLLNLCPNIINIINSILDKDINNSKIWNAEISIVKGYGKIPRHCDSNYRPYCKNNYKYVRLHIPIQTTKYAIFYIDYPNGKKFIPHKLKEGILYKLNVNHYHHAVKNRSPQLRIHLIIDVHSDAIKNLSWESYK